MSGRTQAESGAVPASGREPWKGPERARSAPSLEEWTGAREEAGAGAAGDRWRASLQGQGAAREG